MAPCHGSRGLFHLRNLAKHIVFATRINEGWQRCPPLAVQRLLVPPLAVTRLSQTNPFIDVVGGRSSQAGCLDEHGNGQPAFGSKTIRSPLIPPDLSSPAFGSYRFFVWSSLCGDRTPYSVLASPRADHLRRSRLDLTPRAFERALLVPAVPTRD